MARCREFYDDKDTDFTLVCDLDEHENIFPIHYDQLKELEWRHPLVVAGVPATRTSPPRTMKAKASKTPLVDEMIKLKQRSIL